MIFTGLIGLLVFLYWRTVSVSEGSLGVWPFFVTSLVFSIATFVVWYHSYKSERDVSLLVVILYAVAFRALGVGAFPILEDDIYRFLWDGRQTVEIGSPYSEPPSRYFEDETLSERWRDILGGINHPDVATVYGPVAQYSFAFSYLIDSGAVWPLQLLVSLFDLLLIVLLAKITTTRNLLLYAWSPLIMKEFAFTAHPDVIGAFFLVLGVVLLRSNRAWVAGCSFAAALGIKIIAIVAIPLLIRFNWRAWIAMLGTMVILALPFGLANAWLPEGLKQMSQAWAFNAPIHLLFIESEYYTVIKAALTLALAVSLLMLFYREIRSQEGPVSDKTIDRAILAFALLFLCSPVVNAWYLVWLLVLGAIRPRSWIWVASVTVLLAYFSGINLPGTTLALYQQPVWLVCVEFGLVIVAYLITNPTLRQST